MPEPKDAFRDLEQRCPPEGSMYSPEPWVPPDDFCNAIYAMASSTVSRRANWYAYCGAAYVARGTSHASDAAVGAAVKGKLTATGTPRIQWITSENELPHTGSDGPGRAPIQRPIEMKAPVIETGQIWQGAMGFLWHIIEVDSQAGALFAPIPPRVASKGWVRFDQLNPSNSLSFTGRYMEGYGPKQEAPSTSSDKPLMPLGRIGFYWLVAKNLWTFRIYDSGHCEEMGDAYDKEACLGVLTDPARNVITSYEGRPAEWFSESSMRNRAPLPIDPEDKAKREVLKLQQRFFDNSPTPWDEVANPKDALWYVTELEKTLAPLSLAQQVELLIRLSEIEEESVSKKTRKALSPHVYSNYALALSVLGFVSINIFHAITDGGSFLLMIALWIMVVGSFALRQTTR
jgi:hypothetical protein